MVQDKNIRIRVAGICLDKNNRLLLVNHQKNGKSYWLLPGGGVEYGETLHEALKREFMEEMSLNVKKAGELLFVNDSIYPGGKRHVINMYFRVRVSGVLKPNPDHILKNAVYMKKSEFKKILFYPDIKNDIMSMWSNKFMKQAGYLKTKWKD
ncbi:MAG: NUDIX hydrolase [Candidatus Goldiibacteriota bacterium HGW-Goldbacteria-1]|nr:MAG: NUDIX hydrolase [Candidatus Goldiibacteriota bacterium HGW-Goldbacteria-1]